MKRIPSLLTALLLLPLYAEQLKDSLPPFTSDKPQGDIFQLWAGWDPSSEPLDVEVLHEWEQDEVVLQIVRYRVGVFKGQKSMMAGVFGYPKEGGRNPGLVQVHGGGQYADANAVLTNAKRGYATLSIAWAGRLNAPDYRVSPNEVKLFWDGKTEDPNYRVTTDWGALDAYHHPSRHGKDAFSDIPTEDWTIDSVNSGRNSSWFPIVMAARRAITFLQKQKVVDSHRIGIYGHSMGGKITVLTAGTDWRVTAAVPSCGGVSDRDNKSQLHRDTIGDLPYLKNTSCPILFLNPVNDFHANFQDFVGVPDEIKSQQWRYSFAPHLSHVDIAEHHVATQMWFDHYLKFRYRTPKTPRVNVQLDNSSGIPMITVQPDASQAIASVDLYYTQQGEIASQQDNGRPNRFWHHARPQQDFGVWSANLPIGEVDKPLWVYANITYALDEEVAGAGYYYGDYKTKTFVISSVPQLITKEQLQAAGISATLQPSPLIESFRGSWQKQWYSRNPTSWKYSTHKVNSPLWAAPEGAKLALTLKSAEANTLLVEVDGKFAECALQASDEWQTISLSASEFKNYEGEALASFAGINTLGFSDVHQLRSNKDKTAKPKPLGKAWTGADPIFRELRWDVSSSDGPTATAPKRGDYRWTTDHMHIGVRWQPHSGLDALNEADFQRDVLSHDSSYVQFWVSWGAIEPSQDNLDYRLNPSNELRNIEKAVNLCNAAGKKVEFVFFHCPAWASVTGSGGGQMPKEGLYPQFVRRVASHFKGRVHAYQLYHEANLDAMMEGASIDFLKHEIFIKGANVIREVYGEEPVLVSTSGLSPCIFCGVIEGLGSAGDSAINSFYDQVIAEPNLMGVIDALNMNVSDQNDGFGGMNGAYLTSSWGNFELVRNKLDAAGYAHVPVLASESWITWDDGLNNSYDVNRDGAKNEQDAYQKCLTIMGNCLQRGLNTMNFPWSDNSSSWSMGLTKRIDYDGAVYAHDSDLVCPALDGGPDVVTQKLGIRKGDDGSISIGPGGGKIFTVENYAVPGDPNHLHYYIWRWYSQLTSGSDEVIRHAIADEDGNNISVGGMTFAGSERYRMSSYNRTQKEFTVLLYANAANGTGWGLFNIPAKIQSGKQFNTDKSKIDFRGEGLEDGSPFTATLVSKNICRQTGRDLDLVETEIKGIVTDGKISFNLPGLQPFTTIKIK